MIPALLKPYLEFKEKITKEDWVIIDKTPDVYTAFTLSDCYYGAGAPSALYPITGKPILITDYKYPQQISMEKIDVDGLIATASKRMLYAERNVNTLSVFLEHLSVFESQKKKEKADRKSEWIILMGQ